LKFKVLLNSNLIVHNKYRFVLAGFERCTTTNKPTITPMDNTLGLACPAKVAHNIIAVPCCIEFASPDVNEIDKQKHRFSPKSMSSEGKHDSG
jgi:hypothetical protein